MAVNVSIETNPVVVESTQVETVVVIEENPISVVVTEEVISVVGIAAAGLEAKYIARLEEAEEDIDSIEEKTDLISVTAPIDLDTIEPNNISDEDAAKLIGGEDTILHYHTADRDRGNHTGTQTMSTLSDYEYIHTQGVASALWTVNHNLNRYPAVTVRDSAKNVIQCEIDYVDLNTLIVTSAGAFSGVARCN